MRRGATHTFISHFYDRLGKFIEIDLHRYIFNATGNYISYYTLYLQHTISLDRKSSYWIIGFCVAFQLPPLSLTPIKPTPTHTFGPFRQQPLSIFIIFSVHTIGRERKSERDRCQLLFEISFTVYLDMLCDSKWAPLNRDFRYTFIELNKKPPTWTHASIIYIYIWIACCEHVRMGSVSGKRLNLFGTERNPMNRLGLDFQMNLVGSFIFVHFNKLYFGFDRCFWFL